MYFIEEKLSTVSWFDLLSVVNRKYKFLIPLAEKKDKNYVTHMKLNWLWKFFIDSHDYEWVNVEVMVGWNLSLYWEINIDFNRIYDLFRPAVVSINNTMNEYINL